jgi:hypothetical protein
MSDFFAGLFVLAVIALILYRRNKAKLAQKEKAAQKLHFSPSRSQTSTAHRIDSVQFHPVIAPERPKQSYIIPSQLSGMALAYKYTDVDIAGVKYALPNYAKLHIGAELQFTSEPNNPYDSKAILVECNGMTLGYVHRGKLQDMINDWLKKHLPIWSCISELSADESIIKMCLAFYNESEYMILSRSPAKRKIFRLVGNSNEEMQMNIDLCSVSDSVSIDYDIEKGKNLVSCGGDIGYLPESAEDFISGKYSAFVEETDTNESGKSIVKIIIFQQ